MNPEQQLKILERGAEEILPHGALLGRLREAAGAERPLRVKMGFDPTAPDIHLGHTVGLLKLRQFQDLGHQVVVIVGDYTGLVGDPSGQSRTRPQLSVAEIEANAGTYLEQFFSVLDRDPEPPRRPVEIRRNGEWFSRMTLLEVLRLASQYTLARMLERDDFAMRVKAQQPISIHELLYPLMQGYDSVAVKADVELGGTDQKFNLLVGRALQEIHGQSPQIALTMPILPGLDGVQKMSKSLGNTIGVRDAPREMFGKLMSLPDRLMGDYWRLVTDADPGELETIEGDLRDGSVHPRASKEKLANRVVRMYHGPEAADQAQRDFATQFSRGGVPGDLPSWDPGGRPEIGIKDLLVESGLAASGSAAWRAVDQGAVSIDGVRITDRLHRQPIGHGFVLKLGRRMVRVLSAQARSGA